MVCGERGREVGNRQCGVRDEQGLNSELFVVRGYERWGTDSVG